MPHFHPHVNTFPHFPSTSTQNDTISGARHSRRADVNGFHDAGGQGTTLDIGAAGPLSTLPTAAHRLPHGRMSPGRSQPAASSIR